MRNPVRLERDDSQPGLWVNRNWKPGTAGIFAVVIGVSDYENLPAPDDQTTVPPYGLTKLAVSALTALRIFEWLRDDCYLPGCPLAKSWALFSPTPAERQFESQFHEHTTAPTFANCQTVLRSWHRELKGVVTPASDQSRTFFFFSGHGFEVIHGYHVLLPSDWLQQEIKNDALCVRNLCLGLAGLEVPRQFFFIDACRGDHAALRGSNLIGQQVLDESLLVYGTHQDLVTPILHATSAGQASWQHEEPGNGLSLIWARAPRWLLRHTSAPPGTHFGRPFRESLPAPKIC